MESTLRAGDRINFADNYPVTPGTVHRVLDESDDPHVEVIWDDGFADPIDRHNSCGMDSNVYYASDLEPLVAPDLARGLRAMIDDGWGRIHVGAQHVVEIDGSERDQGYEVDDDEEATEAIYRATPGAYVVDVDAEWNDGPMVTARAEALARRRVSKNQA